MGTQVGLFTPKHQIGVAPKAKWISCRSLGPNASIATILTCLQWLLAPTDLNGNNPDTKKDHMLQVILMNVMLAF